MMKLPVICLMVWSISCAPQGQDSLEETTYDSSTFTYKTMDGHSILADVHRLDDEQSRPVLMWIHSGALIFGSRKSLKEAQLLKYVEAGYVVVAIDHRLAPESLLPEIVKDVQDAYYWIREKGPELFDADPQRIAVVGHSAGGYLALSLGYRVDPPPAAIVSFYGYGDLTGQWYTQPSAHYTQNEELVTEEEALAVVGEDPVSDPPGFKWPEGRGKFYLYCRQQGIWPLAVSGHDPITEYEWFRQYEPVRNVTSAYPPTLLLHGEADEDVPYQCSLDMIERLKEADVDYEFVSNPEWDHMFDNKPERIVVVDRVLEFLAAHNSNQD